MYEKIYLKVNDAIREGDTIARPMKVESRPKFHFVAAFFFAMTLALPPLVVLFIKPDFYFEVMYACGVLGLIALAFYFMVFRKPVVEDLVINMIDVGEETGELDVMLYKVADYYEEEVQTLTDGMIKMIEPAMIIFLGGVVLFIVVSLFLPLISIIGGLSGGKMKGGTGGGG
jgi:type IV pilus assembly protein PilC